MLDDIPIVILAGGLGTRLREAVPDLPKALAPIGDRSFLSILIEMLSKKGGRSFVLCVGYRSDQIREELGDGRSLGIDVRYSVERDALFGTAGALKLAQEHFDPRALVMNGDTYFDIDYEAFCSEHFERVEHHGALASLAVSRVENAARFGTIESDDDSGRVAAFLEKQDGGGPGWVNGGVYLLERALIETIPADTFCSLEKELLPHHVGPDGSVFAHRSNSAFFDIGTPDSLLEFVDFHANL